MKKAFIHIVLVLLGVVIFVDALVGDQGVLATMQAHQDYKHVEQLLEQARAENAWLRERSRRLRDDPTAIEDLARRELGLIKPGEKLFILRDVRPDVDLLR
jgi:cell division protein FtsB